MNKGIIGAIIGVAGAIGAAFLITRKKKSKDVVSAVADKVEEVVENATEVMDENK